MFICEKCEELYETLGLFYSLGPCEECGEFTVCLDARVYRYTGPPREKVDVTE